MSKRITVQVNGVDTYDFNGVADIDAVIAADLFGDRGIVDVKQENGVRHVIRDFRSDVIVHMVVGPVLPPGDEGPGF